MHLRGSTDVLWTGPFTDFGCVFLQPFELFFFLCSFSVGFLWFSLHFSLHSLLFLVFLFNNSLIYYLNSGFFVSANILLNLKDFKILETFLYSRTFSNVRTCFEIHEQILNL